MGRLNERLARLEAVAQTTDTDEDLGRLTDEELKRRIGILVELYDKRGWPMGDMRVRAIASLMLRAAERLAEKEPTAEHLEAVQRWKERLGEPGL